MKITCIIVEDEPASQDILKQYVAQVPDLELLKVCGHALEANEALTARQVQLMFLDINMPKLSGINFYRSLTNPPHVIFTTAYPEYAVDGFDLNAIDYLLKPFPFERFLKAVNKLKDKLQGRPVDQASGNYILLKADKKIYRVKLEDIHLLEAMGDYVKVHLGNKTIIVHDTLQGMQDQLPAHLFARVHKSFVISLERFEHIEGNMAIIASRPIPIGQSYRHSFMEQIQKGEQQRGGT